MPLVVTKIIGYAVFTKVIKTLVVFCLILFLSVFSSALNYGPLKLFLTSSKGGLIEDSVN